MLQLIERLLLLLKIVGCSACAHRLVLRVEEGGVALGRVLVLMVVGGHVVGLGLQIDHLLVLLLVAVDLLQAGLFKGRVLRCHFVCGELFSKVISPTPLYKKVLIL